ncbi:hypothetical protein [Hyalangium versicolor]|uniref:hypothetical protein n=1 Tax=Hyalangium versicolor TaxID=2861190 RepID=UPI001CCD01F6|nr:hypothetical protein [Hyalangium versicolor]
MPAAFLVVLSTVPSVAHHFGALPQAQEATSVPGASRTVPSPPSRRDSRPEDPAPHAMSEIASAQASLIAVHPQAPPREAEAQAASAASLQVASTEASPPPIEAENSQRDGLPAAGMRCSVEGGALQCGACRTDGDCPAGSGCVANRETRRFECLASECEEDAHCFQGRVCRPVTTGATGPVIRRCAPTGTRREGEPCDGLFISPAGSCQEGLTCHRGVCSTPCRPGEPTSCPTGHVCEEGTNGPACFPDCRARGCPEGQRCKRLDDTDYQCLAEVKGECPETPCGPGERCNLRLSQGRGVFWCAPLCNPLQADTCPTGQVCGIGSPTSSTCYRRCDPLVPDSCGDGWQCTTVSEDMTQWGCSPMSPR